MPSHYTYSSPDKTILYQGDILKKTDELVRHLQHFHPYYGHHKDYRYFMVLTQSCDLACRSGQKPKSPYITLAAVRPVEEAVRREAAKLQTPWQVGTSVIDFKARDKLAMFVEGLMDNNREGYFYCHADLEVGIQQNCCAFLQLAVTLKAEHYPLCLEAKISQLAEPFQAKLGYLIGHQYSRVGTDEWNSKVPGTKVATKASALLKSLFVMIDDRQMQEGVADLKDRGDFGTLPPDEIRDYILKKKVLSRKQKFRDVAPSAMIAARPISTIAGPVTTALRTDADLITAIDKILLEHLTGDGPRDDADLSVVRDKLMHALVQRLSHHLSDANMPQKSQALERIIAGMLSDSQITAILQ